MRTSSQLDTALPADADDAVARQHARGRRRRPGSTLSMTVLTTLSPW